MMCICCDNETDGAVCDACAAEMGRTLDIEIEAALREIVSDTEACEQTRRDAFVEWNHVKATLQEARSR